MNAITYRPPAARRLPARQEFPVLTRWARRQSDATPEQLDAFLSSLDRQAVDALDYAMAALGRDLRAWVKAIPLDQLDLDQLDLTPGST